MIIILISIFFLFDCKEKEIQFEKLNYPKNQISIEVVNEEYSLELLSTYNDKDTLNVIDLEEDKYSSPIITNQVINFYKKHELIQSRKLPVKLIEKKTIKGNKLVVPQTPVTSICYHKGLKEDYYIINGADFCMGITCPEFTGIYRINGEPVIESVSTEIPQAKRNELINFINESGVQLNKPLKCMSLIKDKNFWNR